MIAPLVSHHLTGVAAPLPIVNVDTDMIIPKQYLKTIKRTGLGKSLFAEMRYREDGSENPDFVLNKPAYRKAEILVAGDNFGCGSSREHAPWALLDYGIRCVISTSFADIFYNNCFKNGILPIVLPQEQVDLLMDDASRGSNAVVTVDLEKQVITGGAATLRDRCVGMQLELSYVPLYDGGMLADEALEPQRRRARHDAVVSPRAGGSPPRPGWRSVPAAACCPGSTPPASASRCR